MSGPPLSSSSSSEGNLSAELQQCCERGFASIPMRLSCEERRRRVTEMDAEQPCVDLFFKCCLRGEELRKSSADDSGYGRSKSGGTKRQQKSL